CFSLFPPRPLPSSPFPYTTLFRSAFTVQPSTTAAGAAIGPAVQITALDPAGNPVPSFTGSVTVALGNNPGGSTLSGTTPVAAVKGGERTGLYTSHENGTDDVLTST